MRITFKVYQQPNADFQIDAEASETIADLKAKIKDLKGHDIEKQNIIFCGKGLANDKTLESCKISEKGFLVLTISKPRPPLPVPRPLDAEEYYALGEEGVAKHLGIPLFIGSARKSETTSAPVPPTTTTSTSALDLETVSEPAPPTASVSTFKHVPLSPSASDAGTTSGTVPPTTSVSTFKYVPMSSSSEVVPETASASTPTASTSTSKYVPMSSSSTEAPEITSTSTSTSAAASTSTFKYVPMSPFAPTPAPASAAGRRQNLSQQGSALGAEMTPRAGPSDSSNVAARRNDSQIAQFRELVTRNPEFRQHFIQQLTQDDPELGQSLTQNPELLLQLLDGIGEDEDAIPDGRAVKLTVTKAELGAIERLEALGFPKQAVIEAYFSCDKNEELAANYLLENA